MKFVHLSDLHIGKRVNEVSLIEEQKYILDKICGIIGTCRPDAVIIAGDVYDKQVPSAEAVMLFDDFLVKLSALAPHTFIISGNHDSAERNAFGARLMGSMGIHMSPVYNGHISPVTISDEWGKVHFHMLPYIRPAQVRHFLDEEEKAGISTYDSAVRKAIEKMEIDPNERNILITHQFVTGSARTESEDINVGGLDNVDADAFSPFSYVALGHLHRPQDCTDIRIRYCGSPLKYSFSEVGDQKSVTVVTMDGKGRIERELIPLKPLRDWHDIRGTYEEVTARDFYSGTAFQEDFVRITLTDEQDIPDAVGKLRSIYHNLMELRYDNKRTRAGMTAVSAASDVDKKSPLELFKELYEKQNADSMSPEQEEYMKRMIENIWEGEK